MDAHTGILSFRLIWESVRERKFNMVLLAPDDILKGGSATIEGSVDKTLVLYPIVRALFLIE